MKETHLLQFDVYESTLEGLYVLQDAMSKCTLVFFSEQLQGKKSISFIALLKAQINTVKGILH